MAGFVPLTRAGSGGETVEIPPGPLTALAISPDGRFLGFGFGDGKVVIQDRDLTAPDRASSRR